MYGTFNINLVLMKSGYRYDLPYSNFLLVLLAVFFWAVNIRQRFNAYQAGAFEALHPIIPSSAMLQD